MTASRILHVDAAGSVLFAALLLVDGAALAPHFGLASPALLTEVGVFLLAFAATLVVVARRGLTSRPVLLALAGGDVAWVVACAAVLLLGWSEMSALGRALVIANVGWGELMSWLKYRAAGQGAAVAPRFA